MATQTKTRSFTDENFKLYKFALKSKRSGKSYHFEMFGNSREDAKERLLSGSLKGLYWNHWDLSESV
jgi:hypothetical protein